MKALIKMVPCCHTRFKLARFTIAYVGAWGSKQSRLTELSQ